VNRYNFQGQEKQVGSDYVQFKWRLHDPATGRFLSVDPLAENFHFNSTYAFAENRVINGVELEGLEWENFMSKFKNPNQLAVKPVPSGAGVQNQSYQVVVQNPKKGPSDLRSAFSLKGHDKFLLFLKVSISPLRTIRLSSIYPEVKGVVKKMN
jgi:RHS repeat-associated protein